nr:dynamin family protein [Shouchella xiaoxiensis]
MIQQKQIFTVALSGHFSSGKSTLINHLLGVHLLPTSPIPTSANQMEISYGELGVLIDYTNGKSNRYTGEIDWDSIRMLGMDGETVQKITIQAPVPFLKHGSTLLDTPGVDSTDPTHQNVTLEALFTTDAVLYVMDYNHVKAETNLSFLKQLSDEGKPLILVVNQIDKHDEQELSFTAYKNDIDSILQSWKINYQTIYYTSMYEADQNELNHFKNDFFALLAEGERLAQLSKKRLERSFYLALKRRLADEEEEALEGIEAEIQEDGFMVEAVHHLDQEKDHLHELVATIDNRRESYLKDWDSLFRQVTLFNATLTDQTALWLKAMKPNFKMGLLFSARKTAEERRKRTNELIQKLEDQLQSQLVFHLHQSLQSLPLEQMTNKEPFLNALEDLSISISEDFLKEALPKSTFSDQYVYQYTKDKTDQIKRMLRKKAFHALEVAEKELEVFDQSSMKLANQTIKTKQKMLPFVQKLRDCREQFNKRYLEVERLAKKHDDSGKLELEMKEAMKQATEPIDSVWHEGLVVTQPKTLLQSTVDDRRKGETYTAHKDVDLLSLQAILAEYREEQWGIEWRDRIQRRMDSTSNERFTVSLFGAFSAGKSSFANALLGDDVLPTSPHPTTATVTTVTKSTEESKHGSVHVTYKSYDELDKELASISRLLAVQLSLKSIQSFRVKTFKGDTAAKKQALSYVETLQTSLKEKELLLATVETVSIATLSDLVANESTACLISNVLIHYDCHLTEKGLTLVDTPGVNSINGRHTNVAYEQVKQSDAIFYVTYYNHSFSKADAQFIEQLGKINQQFTSKKLYFILNAIDLASSEEERLGVESYVRKSLLQAGVDDAQLYPVSSKQALTDKKQKNVQSSLFRAFEQELYGPMITSFKQLGQQALMQDIKSYCSELYDLHMYANLNKEEQALLFERATQYLTKVTRDFATEEGKPFKLRLTQEAIELFTYLRERIHFVVRDQFNEYLNVSTITGTSKKQQKEALRMNLIQWKEEGVYFLAQELKATNVRLSLLFQRHHDQWINEWQEMIKQNYSAFYLNVPKHSVSFTMKLEELNANLALEQYTNQFTSARTFFEQGILVQMKEDAAKELSQQLSAFIREMEATLIDQIQAEVKLAHATALRHVEYSMENELKKRERFTNPSLSNQMRAEQEKLENRLLTQ